MIWGFWGPGIPDLMTELCPPQDDREEGVTLPHRAPVAQNGILGPKNTRSVMFKSVTWQPLIVEGA